MNYSQGPLKALTVKLQPARVETAVGRRNALVLELDRRRHNPPIARDVKIDVARIVGWGRQPVKDQAVLSINDNPLTRNVNSFASFSLHTHMGVGRGNRGPRPPWILRFDIFSKKGCFRNFESEKWNCATYNPWKKTFWLPPKKFTSAPPPLENCLTPMHSAHIQTWPAVINTSTHG